jgi:hypothetical protein
MVRPNQPPTARGLQPAHRRRTSPFHRMHIDLPPVIGKIPIVCFDFMLASGQTFSATLRPTLVLNTTRDS